MKRRAFITGLSKCGGVATGGARAAASADFMPVAMTQLGNPRDPNHFCAKYSRTFESNARGL
jgi:hypothetical protein